MSFARSTRCQGASQGTTEPRCVTLSVIVDNPLPNHHGSVPFIVGQVENGESETPGAASLVLDLNMYQGGVKLVGLDFRRLRKRFMLEISGLDASC